MLGPGVLEYIVDFAYRHTASPDALITMLQVCIPRFRPCLQLLIYSFPACTHETLFPPTHHLRPGRAPRHDFSTTSRAHPLVFSNTSARTQRTASPPPLHGAVSGCPTPSQHSRTFRIHLHRPRLVSAPCSTPANCIRHRPPRGACGPRGGSGRIGGGGRHRWTRSTT